MGLRLDNISIEGFRGINQKIDLDLERNSTILFGENGNGKSSILQAIEWCLYGVLPFTDIREFKKEDAIVNLFHPSKEANVSLTLHDERDNSYVIKRRKKMSSTYYLYGANLLKKDPTILNINFQNGRSQGEEAQKEINELLGLDREEFYGVGYLHQETIRDLVCGDIDVRSTIIDRLLGQHTLKEFFNSLPTTQFSILIRKLEIQLDNLFTRKGEIEQVSKKKLLEIQTKLAQRSLNERVQLTDILDKQKDLNSILSEISTDLGIPFKDIEEIESLDSLENNHSSLESQREMLVGKIFTEYQKSLEKTNELKNWKSRYIDLVSRFERIDTKTLQNAEIEKRSIDSEISDKMSRLDLVRTKLVDMEKFRIRSDDILVEIKKLGEELERTKSLHGNESELNNRINELNTRKQELQKEIENQSTRGKFLTFSHKILETCKDDKCPLCQQNFDLKKTINLINEEIGESPKKIKDIEQKSSQLDESINQLKEVEGNLKRITARIEEKKRDLDVLKNGLTKMDPSLSETSDISIEDLLNKFENERTDIQSDIDELTRKKARIEIALKDRESIEELEQLKKKIRDGLGIGIEENLINKLDEKITEKEEQTNNISESSTKIKILGKEFENISLMLEYLREKSSVENVEKSLPKMHQEISELEEKIERANRLNKAYKDIRDATTKTLSEQLKVIDELQEEINEFYSKLLGHNYFLNLRLLVESERKKQLYSIIAQSEDRVNQTYVQTRFSNAQLNSTALALFLSMSRSFPCNLGFIVLDDPTQSMDLTHKEAFIELMRELNQEKQIIIATQDTESYERIIQTIPDIYQCKVTNWNVRGPELIM